MTVREREETGSLRKKHWNVLFGELVVGGNMDMSYGRVRKDDDEDDDDGGSIFAFFVSQVVHSHTYIYIYIYIYIYTYIRIYIKICSLVA